MSERSMVISLNAVKDINAVEIGSKAAGLVRLKQAGFPVPSGFCITATAFRGHLNVNNLEEKIASAVEKIQSASAEDKRIILSEIRSLIANAPLDETLRKQIENHCNLLGNNRMAVRSSATAEDLTGYSFAGQYETYLGIAGLSDCIEAVKKCWASLWTERAYDYRQNNGFDHLTINMAVIVQTLIEADASGVIFTADPVSGYKSRMIIEAVGGLGDALVSGKTAPQRFVIAKDKCRIVSRNLTSDLCIADSTAKKLTKFGKKIEKHFGCPQDIEWSISKDRIFFLQSRPITVIPRQKTWEERQVWTNANTGEVAPDVVTPVTWSVMQIMLKPLFKSVFDLLCVEPGERPLAGLVMGRIYWNINTCVGAVKHLPNWRKMDSTTTFGGEHQKKATLGEIDIPQEDIPCLGGSLLKMLLMLPINLVRLFSCTFQKAKVFVGEMSSQNDRLQNMNFSAMSEKELVGHITAIVEEDIKVWDVKYFVSLFIASPIFYFICNKWFNDANATLANKLLAGVGNMDDAEAGLDLWRLAQKVSDIPEIKKIITAGDDWDSMRQKISMSAYGLPFLKDWASFMARHGHHSRAEIELFNARWSETPDYILSIIRTYVSSINQINPVENHKKLALQREQLAEQCRRKLKNPIKRRIFSHFLCKTQQGFALRENLKSEIVRHLAVLRKILLALGQKLNGRGILENNDDIFFLKFEEIEPLAQGKAGPEVKQIIAARRIEYEKNISITPPKVVIGKFAPDNFVPDTVDTDSKILKGLGVSSGIVTGKARVILRTNDNEQILAGEILVAPFTDPGWTPYFIPAAGIVVDMGGMLSHGSIVAREYGIPAVVNVGDATKIIKTGQTIIVDANLGIVKIL